MTRPFQIHLKSSADLETSYEAIRAGFLALALEKSKQATPYVEEAKALKVAASIAKTPAELLTIKTIQSALLTASGISDKAGKHITAQDKTEAVQSLITKFLEPAGKNFVEELVFRFLLIRGDTIGGSMRNIGGIMARKKLTRSLLSTLKNAGTPYRWLHTESDQWIPMTENDADIENFIKGISWQNNDKTRTVIYNVKVPIVGNNVDLILINCGPKEIDNRTVFSSPDSYIALGELKGGIDPAGADEHWKTARTSLNRIYRSFASVETKPHIFFVGAAIKPVMAREIWRQLEDRILDNAANLTDDNQIASLTMWLCGL